MIQDRDIETRLNYKWDKYIAGKEHTTSNPKMMSPFVIDKVKSLLDSIEKVILT